tara:strand:- start:2759 stop:3055 length:297 start_codon:yes stop_codon:yes gene_type:complete
MTKLPSSFSHLPPKNYSYGIRSFKANVVSIWLHHHYDYSYTSDPVSTIWGFYNFKKNQYFAPINAKRMGNAVDIEDTTPYTSMQLNLNPLEYALYSKN